MMQFSPLAAASSSRCLHVIPTVLQQLPGMAALHHSIHSIHGNSNPNQPSTTACSQCAVPASQRRLVRSFSSKAKGGSSSSSSELVRSVRAMPIKLVSVGKGNSRAAQAMAQEWLEKLARQVGRGLSAGAKRDEQECLASQPQRLHVTSMRQCGEDKVTHSLICHGEVRTAAGVTKSVCSRLSVSLRCVLPHASSVPTTCSCCSCKHTARCHAHHLVRSTIHLVMSILPSFPLL